MTADNRRPKRTSSRGRRSTGSAPATPDTPPRAAAASSEPIDVVPESEVDSILGPQIVPGLHFIADAGDVARFRRLFLETWKALPTEVVRELLIYWLGVCGGFAQMQLMEHWASRPP